MYDPNSNKFCGYSQNDGTIDFYSRIKHFIDHDSIVLDLGAGRAAWFEDGTNPYRVSTRLIKGHAKKVIAVDVDPIVAHNRACDEYYIIQSDIPVEDASVDLIVADYVLEHVEDPEEFVREVSRILKPGGWFCARTPHRYCYVAMAARLISNVKHAVVLSKIQPTKKEIDVFPTFYRMNTLSVLEKYFKDYQNRSFLYRADPDYFFGKAWMYQSMSVMHRILPAVLSGNIFVFFRKNDA